MGGPLAFGRFGPEGCRVVPTSASSATRRGLSRATIGPVLALGLVAAPHCALAETATMLAAAIDSARLTMAPAELTESLTPKEGFQGLAAGPSFGVIGLSAGPHDARSSRFGSPSPSLPRPQARPFMASGPLLSRLSDPSFGPRSRPVAALFRPLERPGDLLLPDPPRTLAGATDLQCLAVAIYHEARDQSLDGQLAVASVILNRAREPKRWGARPCDIVVPGQFSFLSPLGRVPPIDNRESWAIAVEMAREALERGPSSLVGQADHYHTLAVHPDWQDGMERVIRIGDHIFYADASARG